MLKNNVLKLADTHDFEGADTPGKPKPNFHRQFPYNFDLIQVNNEYSLYQTVPHIANKRNVH